MTPHRDTHRFRRFCAALRGRRHMLIVMQDYPDPDAIAAAAGLRLLAHRLARTECVIAHGGVVGRAENQAMVKYLNVRLHPFEDVRRRHYDLIAMVDTQPGTGNNSLPADMAPGLVIDHHPLRSISRRAAFTDIRRRYGATSTIVYEYLRKARAPIAAPLATALFYGIWSDTQDVGRKCLRADVNALLALHPLSSSRMLKEIQHGKVPRAYFRSLANALARARLAGRSIATGLGPIDNPDMIGEVADLLLRHAGIRWSLCYGFYDHKALFSLRTADWKTDVGALASRMAAGEGTGGGHAGAAGGQILMRPDTPAGRRRIETIIVRRFRQFTRVRGKRSTALVPPDPGPDNGG